MRIHTTSKGLDPTRLVPGEDIVLDIDQPHGVDLPVGVMALDHLNEDERRDLDRNWAEALERWRATYDGSLTVGGICLPFIWERHIMVEALGPAIRHAAALRKVLEVHAPASITLADDDWHTEAIVTAVASDCGVVVEESSRARATAPARRRPRRTTARRARRALFHLLAGLAAPSRLRPESILIYPYWQVMPLLDRMLAGDRWRPAIYLHKRPAGVARSLRAALRGGWVGLPGPRAERLATARATVAIETASQLQPPDFAGLPLGPYVRARTLELAKRQAGLDLALAATLRQAFRRGRLTRVVVPFDMDPDARLVVSLAKEAGIPTLLVAHGLVSLPRTLIDMEVSEELALWSPEIAGEFTARGRKIHVIGYPVPHRTRPTKAYVPSRRPRIVVLGQPEDLYTSLVDARITMRQYVAAVGAVTSRFPDAEVTLRPHPSADPEPTRWVIDRFKTFDLRTDTATEIIELLDQSDLCIGGTSTVIAQAALVGTPAIVLNLTGIEWRWPLGGNTTVPVARSERELRAELDRWVEQSVLPGGDDLLRALGAGGDGPARILEVLCDALSSPSSSSTTMLARSTCATRGRPE